jgi:hypothetical protein
MNHKAFFDEMFAHVDALDARGFAGCFTEGGVSRFEAGKLAEDTAYVDASALFNPRRA